MQVWWGVLESEDSVGHGGTTHGLVRNRNQNGIGFREDLEAVAPLEQACR